MSSLRGSSQWADRDPHHPGTDSRPYNMAPGRRKMHFPFSIRYI